MGIKNFLSKTRVIDIQSCLPDGVILITTEGLIQWTNLDNRRLDSVD